MKVQQKKSRLYAYMFVVTVIVFIMTPFFIYAQTCTNTVGGTTFNPIPEHMNDYYFHMNFAEQDGPSGNFLTSPAALASDVLDFLGNNFVYAVTSNPNKLRSDFVDVDDFMCVIKLQTGTNSPLFNYNIYGLQPGSNYSVRLKIYHLPIFDSDCHNSNKWQQTNLRIGVNPDQYGNGLSDYSLGSEAASWGKSFDFTINGTLAAGESNLNLEIRTGYNFHTCSAIGIAEIEVIGCL